MLQPKDRGILSKRNNISKKIRFILNNRIQFNLSKKFLNAIYKQKTYIIQTKVLIIVNSYLKI